MKKLRLLGLVGLMVCGFVFSCTLPMEVIEPKINGVKLNPTFKKITDMVVDSNDNIYILDNNVIKKLDSKGKLTIIGGNEKSEEIFSENMNGDVKTAKFGKIEKIQYVENEKTLYFVDNFFNKNINKKLLRKINKNMLQTILNDKFENIGDIEISKNGNIYISDNRPDENLSIKKLNTSLEQIKIELLDIDYYYNIFYGKGITKILENSQSDFYFIQQLSVIAPPNKVRSFIICFGKFNSNSILRNKKVSLDIGKAGVIKNILLENDNLYIQFHQDNYFNDTFYKISKIDFKEKLIMPDNNSFMVTDKNIIGYIPNNLKISDLNDKKRLIYAFNEQNIYKINIGR